ncbi:5-carboxymethyl-2-hydroxymuconate Delta-isomerase [Chitiniphilus eburneus]|uniref:5-carboxymethyl-2-hydroxymuconate Delta-isomerase n=1 Tax=Chitiniphilus eburneus TaxID=2571148 RepID=A0A4U0PYV6_9NEIS|nr:5-carboxymethyl-2-hydroxymuconate Delta-isomerase [Chitiniphilus eburneus]TJZ73836.1 5-carboxymethyl-2-hydroxymuconate Delta-isomerase [Chitiniphilus eburneus]
MPHLTVEYTDNLPTLTPLPLLQALNHTLAATGLFNEIDIKSRARVLDAYVVGTAGGERAFVHARLAVLAGRPESERIKLGQRLLAVLQDRIEAPAGTHLQCCAEVIEIERESYAKSSN